MEIIKQKMFDKMFQCTLILTQKHQSYRNKTSLWRTKIEADFHWRQFLCYL